MPASLLLDVLEIFHLKKKKEEEEEKEKVGLYSAYNAQVSPLKSSTLNNSQ